MCTDAGIEDVVRMGGVAKRGGFLKLGGTVVSDKGVLGADCGVDVALLVPEFCT